MGAVRPHVDAIPTADVSDLVELLEGPAPFVTAVIRSEVAVPNAAAQTERHWRVVRTALERQGAAPEVLDAIAEAIDGAHDRGPALGVVADAEGSLHVEDFDHPVDRDAGWLAALPRLGGIIEDRQSRVPYVLVLADRVGADIGAVLASGAEVTHRSDHDDHPLTKVRAGGWSHRRMQQRAENTWEHNASEVADEVTRITRSTDPRVVFLAGDVRAVELLQDSLPVAVAERVEVIPGTRAAGGDPTGTSREVERLLATHTAAETRAVLQILREELGQHDRATEGPEATLAALRRGQVATLLVHDDPDDERSAWFGAAPTAVGIDRSELDADAEGVAEGRLVDVAIRSALGTGAGVRAVPAHGGPADGLGAILRWAD